MKRFGAEERMIRILTAPAQDGKRAQKLLDESKARRDAAEFLERTLKAMALDRSADAVSMLPCRKTEKAA